ncbi:MAG: ATP-binding protein [Acidobacteriota bacterium]
MKKIFFIGLALFLSLSLINIIHKIQWKEPSDGLIWEEKPSGLFLRGVETSKINKDLILEKGVRLLSINGIKVKKRADLFKILWGNRIGEELYYELEKNNERLVAKIKLISSRTDLLYFYLAFLGIFSFIVSFIVYEEKEKNNQYYYFFFLMFLLFGFYSFSATGKFNTLDWIFFWTDRFSFILFPAAFLNFALIFPERKHFLKNKPFYQFLLYFPSIFLIMINFYIIHNVSFQLKVKDISLIISGLSKINIFFFGFLVLIPLFVMYNSFIKARDLIIKNQIKWILLGLSLGIVPFILFYLIPFSMDVHPSRVQEFTVLFQILVPVSFVYAIKKWRIMDIEVLVKKSINYFLSFILLFFIYIYLSYKTEIFKDDKYSYFILGVLAIILGATLYFPLKNFISYFFNRVFFKKEFFERKKVLSKIRNFSLRNLDELSNSIIEAINKVVSVDRLGIFLAKNDVNSFTLLSEKGEIFSNRDYNFSNRFLNKLKSDEYFYVYSLKEAAEKFPEDIEFLKDSRMFQFMPLRSDGNIIGFIGMGKKIDGKFLNSEDWEIMKTIQLSASLSIENAKLWKELENKIKDLQRLKDFNERIIESLKAGVVVVDKNENIIGWNKFSEVIFGKKREDVIGKNIKDIIESNIYSSLFTQVKKDYYLFLNRIGLNLPTGERRLFDVSRSSFLGEDDVYMGTIFMFEDITDKITIQQQLITSERLASIGLLAAGIAHEINTPLTGISSYIQYLLKTPSEDEKLPEILKKIESQTERVGRIVKSLLSFSRQGRPSVQKIKLEEMISDIISLLDYKIKKSRIDLNLALKESLMVWGDRDKLQQVFLNIISNAIDAMSKGGVLSIDIQETKGNAIIRIQDTGIGIKKEHLPRIFDPFFTTKGFGKGTGLGLSISYGIIKEHGGDIEVQSEEGKGTTFTIELPIENKKLLNYEDFEGESKNGL